MTPEIEAGAVWLTAWFEAVLSGRVAMSQRTLSSIESHGGLNLAVATAQARGVHLVALTDETGKAIVAASRHPFRTLC